MKLVEARWILQEVDGRSYNYMQLWGRGLVGEAIRTIRNRKSATKADLLLAEQISHKIIRKW